MLRYLKWKSILWAKSLLEAGLGWRIGNGCTCSIWSSNWIPRDTNFKPFSQKLPPDPLHKVSDLLCLTNNMLPWDNSKLEAYFLPVDIGRIKSIPLSHLGSPNILAWLGLASPLGWQVHYCQAGILLSQSTSVPK